MEYSNDIVYIRNIHDKLISTIWEAVMSILNKNLSSKEVRTINRYLSTQINQTELRLTPESKKAFTQAL